MDDDSVMLLVAYDEPLQDECCIIHLSYLVYSFYSRSDLYHNIMDNPEHDEASDEGLTLEVILEDEDEDDEGLVVQFGCQ